MQAARAPDAPLVSLFGLATVAAVFTVLSQQSTLARATPLLLLIGLVFGALTIRFSSAGVPILVAFVFLNLSQALVRRYDFPSLLQLLVVALAFAAWLKRDTEPLREVLRQRLTILLSMYLLLVYASTAWAADRELADERLMDLAKATGIYLLATLLISNERRLRQAMAALAASAFLLGALVFVQLATGQMDNPFFGLARIKEAHIYGDVFQPRIAGPLGDPNFFAQILLLALPVALLMGQAARDRVRKLAWWTAAGVTLATILLTYSRGAMIALAVMGVMLVRALHVRWRTTLAAAALALVVFFLLPPSVTRRFVTIEEILPSAEAPLRPDSSFQERRLLMQVAWVMFGANPIAGVGAGNYSARYEDYAGLASSSARQYEDPSDRKFPHNLFLEVAAETGILGCVLFGAVLFAAWRALRAAKDSPIGQALGIAFVGFLVASLFLHLAFPRYLYLLFAFVGVVERLGVSGSRGLGRQSLRDPETPRPRVRSPIAVLLSRFPLITETFILREVIELERQGQGVVLVPMIRESPGVIHEEAKAWIPRALYTPWVSPEIVAANVRALVAKPGTYLALLGWIVRGTLLHPRTMAKSLLLFPKSVWLAYRLRELEVGHVHAHYATHPATMARIISALSGIPFSFTVHAHDIFVERTLLREKIRDAGLVRAISAFNRGFLENLFEEARGKVEVVHVGVPSRGLGVSGSRLLCVAALKPYKGLPVLAEACAMLGVQCDVIGAGPMKRELQNRPGIRLLGAMPQHEVARAIQECEVFVLPSVIAPDGQMEGIPVALMEAMGAGKAVIATSISGIPELVEHGVNGLLVAPGNARELADAIRTLLGDAELRARLGAKGKEKVEREFRLERTVTELLAILDRHNPRVAVPGIDGEGYGLRAVHRGRDAEVFEVVGSEEIVVKRHLAREGESRPPEVRAADELRILREVVGDERARLVAPDTIVMSPVRGSSLVQLIREARRTGDTRAVEEAARAAGAWLKKFHDTGLIHGDFWPGNVYCCDDGSVSAIDFEGARPGDPQYDVDYFLRHARLYYRYRAHAQWAPLKRAFLEGYNA